jgi:hypothetical protein
VIRSVSALAATGLSKEASPIFSGAFVVLNNF